ncbi:MAG: hypothetical protein SP4CHLAM5_05530 [Chlamydiia bacterium]|nr:hypothetical protein [Chlamydiia bacterium]MCH9618423.1 hypothetical protein [Chlamydiia bacterium]MCH9623749.1 hypothetical protein [Chlamydiia bacterium]
MTFASKMFIPKVMGDLYKNTNIRKYDKNDPRYLKVNESEITRPKHRQSDPHITYKGKPIKKSLLLFARIMDFLGEKFSSPDSDNIAHLPAGEQEFYSYLSSFCKQLHTLSGQDKSSDIEFINDLSYTWDTIKQSAERRKKLKKARNYLESLNQIVKEIEGYGAKDGASFGYYLKEHRNTDWFPLPYLNMLRSLYNNSIENEDHSTLYSWQASLKKVIKQLVNPT